MKKYNFGPVLNAQAIRNRVIENAKKTDGEIFLPTVMAVAFVQAAVA